MRLGIARGQENVSLGGGEQPEQPSRSCRHVYLPSRTLGSQTIYDEHILTQTSNANIAMCRTRPKLHG